MRTSKSVSAKVKAHTVYKNAAGKRVPGTTTITGMRDKSRALVPWANRIGLQGIDVKKYVDNLADIGTCGHYMVECYLKGIDPDLSEYSQADIDKAENALISFYEWLKGRDLEPLLVEAQLVSEKHQYGGTIDLYCKLDGIPTLIDLKTSKGIFPEMVTQVSAYRHLLQENGHEVSDARILRIGRTEDEGFEDKPLKKLDQNMELFLCFRRAYELEKEIRRG